MTTNGTPQQSPGISARDQLIADHLPFVRHIVGRMAVSGNSNLMDFEDLVSHGTVGLIEAAERYDGQRGISFASFAASRIRGAVLDALRGTDPLSRTARQRARLIQAAEAKLAFDLGREPTHDEVREATGLGERQYWDAWRASRIACVSIDTMAPNSEDDHDGPREVPAEEDHDPAGLEHQELLDALVQAIAELPERDRQVIGLRYQENLTLREVAHILGISESRVSQLEVRILGRLRRSLSPYGAAA